MDEILIEDKKYVSSKQAAKITGYAKDYIGQLCREGRVPARLVGRSWYVLESAIQDHRFGNQDIVSKAEVPEERSTTKTWEFPRYQSFQPEELPPPTINRLNELEESEKLVEPEIENVSETAPELPQSLNDSWKEWFDHVADKTTIEPADHINIIRNDEQREEALGLEMEEDEVSVPLHVVSHYASPEYLPEASLPAESRKQEELPLREFRKKSNGNRLFFAFQIFLFIVAILSVSFASLNSGYFDKKIVSLKQFETVSGMSVYNK